MWHTVADIQEDSGAAGADMVRRWPGQRSVLSRPPALLAHAHVPPASHPPILPPPPPPLAPQVAAPRLAAIRAYRAFLATFEQRGALPDRLEEGSQEAVLDAAFRLARLLHKAAGAGDG